MTELFLNLSPYSDECDQESIREITEEIKGRIDDLPQGELRYEKGTLVIRVNTEECLDDDMVVCRTIGVVREEEDDKKGWLVVSKKGQVVSVSKLIDNSDNREEVYQLFSSEDNLGQFANCVGYDSLDQLADSLALVLGISRSSKNPFDIEKNDQ